ncbi:MAG: FHA domain-containing protein [Chloroflexota bacterium]|nr:FHA domain-containing protein [Chloroflexota bacterium]
MPGAQPGQVAGTSNNSGLPWLFLLVLVPLVIAAIAYSVARNRRDHVVNDEIAVSRPAAPAPGGRAAPYMSESAASGRSRVIRTTPAPAAPTTSGAAAAASSAEAAAVTCPNCGTANRPDENFCHECGQDLRPRPSHTGPAAKSVQPAEPVAAVAEDTPYLETLDRVDEQLEFVLSRQRVRIGSAAGNDIVIDSAYSEWESVSPAHAELRREQDDFVLVDLDSENGTYVNDRRTGESILSDGDTVRLGDVRFIFRIPSIE